MRKILLFVCLGILVALNTTAAFEKVNTYNGSFADVNASSWYAENVKTAYELGFMNGKSDGKFDPDGNVTVVEGITMASRLHAAYRDIKITKREKNVEEVRFDFDDPSILVDLSERNSRNTNGINFGRGTGEIKDGMLIAKAGINVSNTGHDTQLTFNGLDLDTRDYNKITIRMKREALPNMNDAPRGEYIEFFFKTNMYPSVSTDRQINIKLPREKNLEDWFVVEADLGTHKLWKDVLTGFRFDPTNDNGIFYIDYIVLSKSENIDSEKWYDMYLDYAIENSIINKDTFLAEEYNRNITRSEICDLFASAIPGEYFAAINDIKGIPDVLRDSENSDVYLMLYKAGILLGADEKGNFKPESDIKRSEISAIINRVALPENRVKGTIDFDWAEQGSSYDIEFDDNSWLDRLTFEAESTKIENGALVLKTLDRGEGQTARFDPKIIFKNIKINSEENTKLKVRYKADFVGEPTNLIYDFYFTTEEDSAFTESKSAHGYMLSKSYKDAAGWYILEVDLSTIKSWKGNIVSYRFDPTNSNGVFTIDYIRFIKADPLLNASHEILLANGYSATTLMQDADWERGFYVQHYENKEVDLENRRWQDYTETKEKPLWSIASLWTHYDLYENRVADADKYTLADSHGVNTIKYNPDEKSVLMRLDATKFYNGEPHIIENYEWWPHLLLNQSYMTVPVDKEKNTAAADRIFVELDMKISDFKDTINKEGMNVCQYLVYFYLLSKNSPNEKIWFGLTLVNGTDSNSTQEPGWGPDSAAHQYIYGIPQATIYGGMENSFNPRPGVIAVSDEWKHIRVDVTPHIERCIEWANRDKAFGRDVTKDDLYFCGANIGFEIHGNYDMTVEIKNFDMISYNKQ